MVALGLLVFGCRARIELPVAERPAPAASPAAVPAAAATPVKEAEPILLPGPNAVPKDTRIVVNIPAFRMDVFHDGTLINSYRIGIGYPQFPLPTGLRKAQLIIFNPSWTPPDSPWVDSMNVTPGETVRAGSKLNPLGPIKIPIGMPSLIHGGKPLSKIGTFASHGCVGMTNAQVKDFAKVLVQASDTDLSDETMSLYLDKRTRTRIVNLNKLIPIELRYETIVVEDGVLHIYRDVYGQNTNTEENLREVFKANGVDWNDLTEDERTQAMDGVNAMSRHPKKTANARTGKADATPSPTASAGPSPNAFSENGSAETTKKSTAKNQKEIVIDIAALRGRGYPAPVMLNTGSTTVSQDE